MANPFPRYRTLFSCGIAKCTSAEAEAGRKRGFEELRKAHAAQEAAKAAKAAKLAASKELEQAVKRKSGRPRKVLTVSQVFAPESASVTAAVEEGSGRRLRTARAGKALGVAPAVLPDNHP
jgi:hypothetical protein